MTMLTDILKRVDRGHSALVVGFVADGIEARRVSRADPRAPWELWRGYDHIAALPGSMGAADARAWIALKRKAGRQGAAL